MEILMINERLVICIAIAAVLIGMAIVAGVIATAECYEHEDDPVDSPAEDYFFTERPYVDRYGN
jgi:hypothetical protein